MARKPRIADGLEQAIHDVACSRNASVRAVPLQTIALAALDELPPNQRYPLVLPSARGGYLDLHNFRNRDWKPAQHAAGIEPLRRVYDLRHTFATFALRAGISTFDLLNGNQSGHDRPPLRPPRPATAASTRSGCSTPTELRILRRPPGGRSVDTERGSRRQHRQRRPALSGAVPEAL
jgi:hypothetical protein